MILDSQGQKDLLIQIVSRSSVTVPIGEMKQVAEQMGQLVDDLKKAEIKKEWKKEGPKKSKGK